MDSLVGGIIFWDPQPTLGFASDVWDLALYWQANFYEASILLFLIPRDLKYDLLCPFLQDGVYVSLTMIHHPF